LKFNGTNHLRLLGGKPQIRGSTNGYTVNPGIISNIPLAMTIPTNPSATIKEETGAIGMALN
jgi:hypothetical protein